MKTAVAILVVAVAQLVVGGKDYEEASLKAHNDYRAKHKDTPPMVLDENLNEIATICAQYYLDGGAPHSCQERKDAKTGENIFWSSAEVPGVDAVKDAANSFYGEIKNYDYSKPGDRSRGTIGHFTQLVWAASTKLGVGYASSPEGGTTVVNLYLSPGNYKGQYDKYVKPLK